MIVLRKLTILKVTCLRSITHPVVLCFDEKNRKCFHQSYWIRLDGQWCNLFSTPAIGGIGIKWESFHSSFTCALDCAGSQSFLLHTVTSKKVSLLKPWAYSRLCVKRSSLFMNFWKKIPFRICKKSGSYHSSFTCALDCAGSQSFLLHTVTPKKVSLAIPWAFLNVLGSSSIGTLGQILNYIWNICFDFFHCACTEKTTTNLDIQNSTGPNWWAAEDKRSEENSWKQIIPCFHFLQRTGKDRIRQIFHLLFGWKWGEGT